MSRACLELSNYQRLLIGMAYTPCYKTFVMTVKINCEFNNLGAWCKCKQVKRK